MRRAWTLLVALGGLASAQGIDAVSQATQHYVQQQVGTFEQYQDWIIGDPMKEVQGVAVTFASHHVPGYVLTLATMIAFLGFAMNLWRAYKFQDLALVRDGFWTFVVSGVLIALSMNAGNALPLSFSKLLMGSWGNTYAWSKGAFAPDLDAELRASSEKFTQMLGEVALAATTVALPESKLLGLSSVKTVATAVRGGAEGVAARETLQSGASAVGKTALANTSAAMSFTANFLTGLIVVYSQLVTYSGLGVLLIAYVLPLGFACLNFGVTRVLWTCVGTFIALWLTAMFLPMITATAMHKVFVEPARIADTYTQELGLRVHAMSALSEKLGRDVQQTGEGLVAACQNALASGAQDASACQATTSGTWFDGLLAKIEDGLKTAALNVTSVVTGLADDLIAIVWKVVFSALFFAIAIGLMAWLSVFLTGLLGGVASDLRPGFSLPKFGGRE